MKTLKSLFISTLFLISIKTFGQHKYIFTSRTWYVIERADLQTIFSRDTLKFGDETHFKKADTTWFTYPRLDFTYYGNFTFTHDQINKAAYLAAQSTNQPADVTGSSESKSGKWEFKDDILKFVFYSKNSKTQVLEKTNEVEYRVIKSTADTFIIVKQK